MGRWAQRRLGGGGASNGSTLIIITEVIVTGPLALDATFSSNINFLDFATGDFHTENFDVQGVGQSSPNSLSLDFSENITGEASLFYEGSAPGVLTPQIVAIS